MSQQQQQRESILVIDRDGLRGAFDATSRAFVEGRGQVLVQLENGRRVFVPVEELLPQADGSFRLPVSLSEFDATGAESAEERIVVPVVAEQLQVQKRKVERGGVRVRKIVHEREEVVDEPLMREEVQVRRVPINRVVESPTPVRHVGNTMIIPLFEEVLVVEKRLMLKEELHITKAEIETYKPQRVVLRREEASIERVEEDDARDARGPVRDGDGGGGPRTSR
jgi:uncharacterized protein (TIGR02271 family)